MKNKIHPINVVPKYKNAKGETIWKIVESRYLNGKNGSKAKRKSVLRLHWGKLPTDTLEKLKLKYNKTARAGNGKAAGQVWAKIHSLRTGLLEIRQAQREHKNPVGRPPQNRREPLNPFNAFISSANSVESWLRKVEPTDSPLEIYYASCQIETLEKFQMAMKPIGVRLVIIERILREKRNK